MSSYIYFPSSLYQYQCSMGNCFTGHREGTQIDDSSLNVDTTTMSAQGASTGMEEIILNSYCNHLSVVITVNYFSSTHIHHTISLTIVFF